MNVPTLRFPEFEGEWPIVRIGNFLSERATSPDEAVPLYSLTIEFGVVPKSARYEREFLVKDGRSAYKLMLEGDFAFNPMNLRFGALGRHKEAAPVKVSKYYNIFSFSDEASREFFEAYLLTNKMIGFYNKMATGSLNEKRRVHYLDFIDFNLPTPSLTEQKKIAAFLGVVDVKIAALRARRAGLTRYKRGLMQALFSQTLRFTKPDGTAFPDWEEKRLGEVATRSTAKNTKLEYMRVLTNSAVQGVVDQGDYFDKDIANAENLAGYYVLKKGDFVYNPRISVSAPVGPIKRNDLGDGVMSPLYTVFRFKQKDTTFYNVYFATTFWHKYMKSVANYGARHDRMAITSGDLMNMPLPHPHPDEQAKIAEALSAMDAKIAAVGDQVTQMEAFKKGMLQQMFV